MLSPRGTRRPNLCVSAVVLAVWIAPATSAHAVVRLTVGTPAQGGQYATLQAAVDAVAGTTSAPNTERHVIDVYPGRYVGRVKIPSHKPFITLRGLGQQPQDVIVEFNETAATPPNESTVHATAVVQGKDFIAHNLTFANTYGPGAQALAMYAKADRLIFDNVRFTGWQDTLRPEFGRQYFHKVYVEGTVDFIYGKGTAYFDDSTLFAKSNGYYTAQGRESAAETNGFVFHNSTLTGSANNGSVYLGRPWQAYSRAIYIDSKMGPIVHPAGWATWSGNNHLTAFFAEYQSKDLSGNLLDVSQRTSWSHQITEAQAAAYTKGAWLGGSDGWDPKLPAAADFNGDGAVDHDDLGAWTSGFYSLETANLATGDANRDGSVDGEDLLIWQRQVSAAVPVALIPEPPATSMILTMVFGLLQRRLAVTPLESTVTPSAQ